MFWNNTYALVMAMSKNLVKVTFQEFLVVPFTEVVGGKLVSTPDVFCVSTPDVFCVSTRCILCLHT